LNSIGAKLENYIKNNKPTKTISSFDRESNSKSFYEDRSLLIYDQGFAILIYSRNGSKPSSYILFTEEAKTEALNIAKSIAKVTINKKQKDSAFINLISLNNRGELDLLKYKINKVQLDLALNYGEEFIKKYEKIINRLSTDNDKGVVLFHGEPGTGKTTLIRKLLYDLKDKKRIIYLPSDISSRLSEPGFMSFIMKYPNSILLIAISASSIKRKEREERNQLYIIYLI
jgi:DNA replication protein DnaC